MNKLIFLILSLPLLFTGCTSNTTQPELPIGISPEIHTAVMDSLKILDSLVNAFRIKDPSLASVYANHAVKLASGSPDPESLAKAYILKGMSLFQKRKDSSFFYYSKALDIVKSMNIDSPKANIYYNFAYLYLSAYDYKSAVVFLDSAINQSKKDVDFTTLSNSLNLLGNVKSAVNDSEGARLLYEEALQIARENDLNIQVSNALNNLSKFEPNAEQSINLQKEAISYVKKQPGTEYELALIYHNIGYLLSDPDSILYYSELAIQIAEMVNLPEIIMGSYNNMAYSYLATGEIEKAKVCLANYAIPIASEDTNHDWLSTLYDSYADVLFEQGDYKSAVVLQKQALEERVLAEQQVAGEQIRLLSIMLDIRNKEITIREQQNDLFIQKSRLYQTKLWLTIVGGILLFFVLFALWFDQRRRIRIQKLKIESAKQIIEREESEKSRIARELHDITGQLLLGLNGMIDGTNLPNHEVREEIKSHINELGKSIRNISHKMNSSMVNLFSFNEMIMELCHDIEKLSGLQIKLSIPESEIQLAGDEKLHAYRIIQELLMNASKYVSSGDVYLNLDYNKSVFSIHYHDAGPGFPTTRKETKGMGLRNIKERATMIGGNAILKSAEGEGTTWEITIPIKKD